MFSIFLLTTLFSHNAFAQNSQGTVVATVNISNAKIVLSNDRDYKISFDISNRVGAQPQIKYSVRLTSSSTNQVIFDEKVYEETISLAENTKITKVIDYSIPSSISVGTYRMWIDSKNENGLSLGTALVGEVKITNNLPNIIQIIPDSCYLVKNTAKEQYLLSQVVLINSTDVVTIKCLVQSNLSTNTIFTPNFITRSHTIFGETVSDTGGSRENIIIKKGISDINIILPKASNPQSYNISFFLKTPDSKTTSNTISINYILSGIAGEIKNVVFDKTYYRRGDTANLQVFSTQTGVSTSTITASITDDTGLCSETTTKDISNFSIINLKIPITKDCTNPKANIILSSNGTILDTQNYEVMTVVSTTTPTFSTIAMFLKIIALVLVVMGLGALVYRKKYLIMIFGVIIISSSLFYFLPLSKVEAYPCTYAYCWNNNFAPCDVNGVLYCYTPVYLPSGCTITSTDIIGANQYCTYTPPIPAPAITSFYATPNPVDYNNSATISASITNSTSCTLTGNGRVISWGSPSTITTDSGPITEDEYFQLYCKGDGGEITKDLTISVIPIINVSIDASATSTTPEGSVDISWNSTNADSCDVTKNDSNWITSTGSYQYVSQFSSDGFAGIKFSSPSGIVRDSAGNLYIADTGNNRIQKFTSDGTYISQFGSYGTDNGQFNGVLGIAFDSSNNIYVVDQGNHRIQKFTSAGTYISQFGSFGSSNGQFQYPSGIATDSLNNIYVVDINNFRIQKFDTSGTYLSQFGSYGGDDSQFLSNPWGIAIDSSNNLYIVEGSYNYGRIKKFTSSGIYISQFGSGGSGEGQFSNPKGIAFDSSNNIYVVDQGNHRIQKFTSAGTYISQFGSFGTGDGQLLDPRGITLDSSGNLYIVDTGNNRIQKFTSAGAYDSKFGSYGTSAFSPNNITLDSSGNIYITENVNNHVQKFTSFGTYLSRFGSSGSDNSQFSYPSGITTDSSNNIYVVDTGNNRIQKFTSSGVYISQFGSGGSGQGQFSGPRGIATDSSNNVYIADVYNHRIQKFDPFGNFLWWLGYDGSSIGIHTAGLGYNGSGNGQFLQPNGVALDSSDNIYVVDTYNYRIQKFNSNGVYLSKFGSVGSGNGQFQYPYGISLDSSGNIYVLDASNFNIQKFNSSGGYVSKFGSYGSANYQFLGPTDLSIDSSGDVYVVDMSSHIIKKFSSPDNNLSGTKSSGPLTTDTTFTATCVKGTYSASKSVTVTVGPTTVSPPTNFAVNSSTCGQIGLSWDSPESTFKIYKDGVKINPDVSFSPYIDVLPVGDTNPHSYYVIANNAILGDSIPSNTLSAIASLCTTPEVVSNATCTLLQAGNASGDTNIYVNRTTTLRATLSTTDVEIPSLITKWTGTNIPTGGITLSGLEYNKIYTTIGPKTINAETSGTLLSGETFTSSCSTTTIVKLDPGTGGEI